MKNLAKEKFIHAKDKMLHGVGKFTVGLATGAAMLGVPVPTYAFTFNAASHGDANSIMGKLVDTVGTIMTYGGVLVLIGAVVAFLLAFRNEDVEGKHKAGLAFAIGIAMVSFDVILKGIGITSGK